MVRCMGMRMVVGVSARVRGRGEGIAFKVNDIRIAWESASVFCTVYEQKRKVAKTLLMQNASAHTSETQVGQPSTIKIAQTLEDVNIFF